MAAPTASSCIVVLNQQREQAIQHHDQYDKAPIAPCNALTHSCTIVENGRVVVKPLQPSVVEPTEP
jgi:hypothetical protein